MDQSTHACTVCGHVARVRILENYIAGEPVIRHFCFRCADRYFGESTGQEPPSTQRISFGSLLVLAGVLVSLTGIAGDYLGIGGNPGFGWYKQTGLFSGTLLICLGAFWRIDVIGVAGILVFVLAGSANLLHLSGRDGFGWKHYLAMAIGLCLMTAGMLVRRISHPRTAVRNDPSHIHPFL